MAIEVAEVQASLTLRDKMSAQMREASEKFAAALGKMEEAIKKAKDESEGLGEKAWSSGEKIKEAFENPLETIEKFGKQVGIELVEQFGALSMAATASITVIAGVGLAMFELAKNAAEVGGHLNDMGEKTGMSVPALGRLKNAVDVAGGSFDQVANSVFMFEQRMGQMSAKFMQGMKNIGVTVEEMKAAGPDHYLELIAHGLAQIEDPAVRASTATDLMGRSVREMIPTLMKLDQSLEMTADIEPFTDEEAKKAEEFEMQLASLKVHAEAWVLEVGRNLIPTMSTFVSVMVDVISWGAKMLGWATGIIPAFRLLGGAWEYASAALTLFKGGVKDLEEQAKPATVAMQKQKDAIVELGIHVPQATEVFALQKEVTKELTADAKELEAAHKKEVEAQKKIKEATDNANSSMQTLSGEQIEAIKYYREHGASVDETAKILGVYKHQVEEVTTVEKILNKMREDSAKNVRKYLDDEIKDETSFAKDEERIYLDQQAKLEAIQKENARTTRQHSTDTFTFQREQVAQWLEDERHKINTNADNWKEMWDALDAQSAEKMRVIAQNEQDALDEMHKHELTWANEFNLLLGSIPNLLVKAFTGGGGLSGAMTALMSSVSGDIGAKLFVAGGPLNALGNSMTRGMTSMFGDSIGNALGMALPGIGQAIGALLPTLFSGVKKLFGGPGKSELEGRDAEKQFQDQFGSFQEMMEQVGKAYEATGRSAAQAQQDVKRLMDAEKQGGDAVKQVIGDINQAFSEQKQDTADLQVAIEKYGFTIEELGPTMQKQRLDEQAKTLINDWRLLVASGIDVDVVNKRMADSMSEYLQMAIKTGTEVPKEMEPIIKKMIEQGDLVDENGKALGEETLKSIKFSETMTQGFDRVVQKLDELLQNIGMIPQKLAQIPASMPPIDIELRGHWNVDDMPGQQMAGGGSGRVSGPTLFMVGESGPEDYSFSGANRSFGDSGGSNAEMLTEMRGLRGDLRDMMDSQERTLRDAMIMGSA